MAADEVNIDDTITNFESVKLLAGIALPAAAGSALTLAAQTASTLFVGNYLGPDHLAAQSIAIRIIGITGIKVGAGCASALDTICSQEHGRCTTSNRHGEFVQRSFDVHVVLIVLCESLYALSPYWVPRIFAYPLAEYLCEFIRYGIFYIAPMLFTASLTKMLQAQGLALLPMRASLFSAFACVGLNFALIRFGLTGAILALAGTATVQLIATVVLLRSSDVAYRRWGHRRPLKKLMDPTAMKGYLKLAIPSALFVVCETTPFTTMMILAGVLGGPMRVLTLLPTVSSI